MALTLTAVKQNTDQNLFDVLSELTGVKAQLAELKKQEKLLTNLIQRAMGDEEVMEDGDGNSLATWKFSERKSFDSKRFEEEHPDLYLEYLNTKQVRTFRI